MNKVQFLGVFVAVFVLALVPEPSLAAIRPYALTLTPFAGGYVFEGNRGSRTGRFTVWPSATILVNVGASKVWPAT
jgi:hypothetical protein